MFLGWFLLILGSVIFYIPLYALIMLSHQSLLNYMPEQFFYYFSWLSLLMAFGSLIPAGMFLKERWDDFWYTVISAILVGYLLINVGLLTLAGGLRGAI